MEYDLEPMYNINLRYNSQAPKRVSSLAARNTKAAEIAAIKLTPYVFAWLPNPCTQVDEKGNKKIRTKENIKTAVLFFRNPSMPGIFPLLKGRSASKMPQQKPSARKNQA